MGCSGGGYSDKLLSYVTTKWWLNLSLRSLFNVCSRIKATILKCHLISKKGPVLLLISLTENYCYLFTQTTVFNIFRPTNSKCISQQHTTTPDQFQAETGQFVVFGSIGYVNKGYSTLSTPQVNLQVVLHDYIWNAVLFNLGLV